MTTLAIMQRLQLNWQEISGIKRAYLFEPTTTIDSSNLPAVYPVQLGRMTQPVPARSVGDGNIPLGAGQYVVEREYIYRCLIEADLKATMDSADEGAKVDQDGINLIDNAIDYFAQRPRLATATLSDIPQLVRDMTVKDSGLVTRLGPGGAQYRAIDYTFVISERRITRPSRIS